MEPITPTAELEHEFSELIEQRKRIDTLHLTRKEQDILAALRAQTNREITEMIEEAAPKDGIFGVLQGPIAVRRAGVTEAQ